MSDEEEPSMTAEKNDSAESPGGPAASANATVPPAPLADNRAAEPPSTGDDMGGAPFVLDRAENPHPKMLAGAIAERWAFKNAKPWSYARGRWVGYLSALCDATGETPEAIEAWMDREEARHA